MTKSYERRIASSRAGIARFATTVTPPSALGGIGMPEKQLFRMELFHKRLLSSLFFLAAISLQ